MRLKETFIVHDSDGEQILIDTEGSFHGLVRSNPTAAFIVDCLKKETTKEEIIAAMCKRYDAPQEVIAGDVTRIISSLCDIGALDDDNRKL